MWLAGLALAISGVACAADHGAGERDAGIDASGLASRCTVLCQRVNRCPSLPCPAVSDCECAAYCGWLATAGCDAEFDAFFACTSALSEDAYCARACDTSLTDACAAESEAAAACVSALTPSVPDAGCP